MSLFSNAIPFSDLFCCGRVADFKERKVDQELKTVLPSAEIDPERENEVTVPDDCDLLEAFSKLQDDMTIKIKAGEYEWDGDVVIERRRVRIEGEEGAYLYGSIVLKAGSSGSIYNLEVNLG